jgi:YD repeat-containing protein
MGEVIREETSGSSTEQLEQDLGGEIFAPLMVVAPGSPQINGDRLSIAYNGVEALAVFETGVVNTVASGSTATEVIAPLDGESVTISDGIGYFIISPASQLNILTITTPSNPVDGHILTIAAGEYGTSSLALLPNTGQSFEVGAEITSLGPNESAQYLLVGSVWCKVGAAATGGGAVSLGGDLSGTASNATVKKVSEINKSFTYDGQGRLSTITDTYGTKTMTYDLDGNLSSITGTGLYKNKSFTYSLGVLQSVTVS